MISSNDSNDMIVMQPAYCESNVSIDTVAYQCEEAIYVASVAGQ